MSHISIKHIKKQVVQNLHSHIRIDQSINLRSFFLCFGNEVVKVILDKDRNHGVRSHSKVESGETNPQTEESLVFDTLYEAIDNIFIGELSSRI